MVKIIGKKDEIALIVDMLNSSDTDSTTYTDRGMKKNEFGIQGQLKKQDLDFTVYTTIENFGNGISNNNWTLCDKHLPEHTGYYLVTTIYGSVEKVKFFHKVKKWNGFGEYQKNVIAWRPMIEPYVKEGGK